MFDVVLKVKWESKMGLKEFGARGGSRGCVDGGLQLRGLGLL